MVRNEIIDVDIDPEKARRLRWKRLVRVGVPLLGVLLITSAIMAIAYVSYSSNRRDALALSEELIEAIDSRVRSEVRGYLQPAVQAVTTMAGALPEDRLTRSSEQITERFALQILSQQDQLSALYAGDADGSFLMVQRTPEGTFDTKIVRNGRLVRQVLFTRRDRSGKVTAVEHDPSDTFDPRTRPWFKEAMAGKGIFWTDLYVSYSAQKPGVTVSVRGRRGADPDNDLVVGADIILDELSRFLQQIDIGEHGRAMIIDHEGHLIAFPDPAKLVRQADGGLKLTHLDDLNEPVLSEIYNRLRVAGAGRSIMKVDGERYLVAANSLEGILGRRWSLLLVAPEQDFVGFVAENNRKALLYSSGIVVLTAALAALLAYQGMTADRHARTVARREEILRARTAALVEIAATAPAFLGDQGRAAQRVTERLAKLLDARRVSLWQVEEDGDSIVCADGFEGESGGHAAGATIDRGVCPRFFAALMTGERIEAADAESDPRTDDLFAAYLQPIGSRSILCEPIATAQAPVGFIWVEDKAQPEHFDDDTQIIRAAAAALALPFAARRAKAVALDDERRAETRSRPSPALDAGARLQAAVPAGQPMRRASLSRDRHRRLAEDLHQHARGEKEAVSVFAEATVLVLRVHDDIALAGPSQGDSDASAIQQIVSAFEQAAETSDVRYVKILSQEIVAADGFDGEPASAAMRLADLGLALQQCCVELLGRREHSLDVTLGLDTGPAMGAAIGFGDAPYNLWGDAVRTASRMAETAPLGAVQVSEPAYHHLKKRFVLRRRGSFYLDRYGEVMTFTLRGRL